MTTHKEALTLALEALEIGWSPKYVNGVDAREKGMKAITAIKEALSTKCVAQSASYKQSTTCGEPVAVVDLRNVNYVRWLDGSVFFEGTKLYTTPYVGINWGAVHDKLMDVWHRELSADEGLDEIQDLIDITPHKRSEASKPLTIDQIASIAIDRSKPDGIIAFVRAIEAAHGITASEAEDSARSKT